MADPLFPQGSAFVLVKALPAMSCSFSSPPSSRISPWPAPWPLRTSISHPERMVWAEYLPLTRSASYPSEWGKRRGPKDFTVNKCLHLSREWVLTPFTSARHTVKQYPSLPRLLTMAVSFLESHHATVLESSKMCFFSC
jgi:hypothetical protein